MRNSKISQSFQDSERQQFQENARLSSIYSIKLQESALKLQESTVKLNNSKVGLNNSTVSLESSSVKLQDSSLKLNDSSVSLNDSSVKLNDSTVKLQDSSVKRQFTTSRGESLFVDHTQQYQFTNQIKSYHPSTCYQIVIKDIEIKKLSVNMVKQLQRFNSDRMTSLSLVNLSMRSTINLPQLNCLQTLNMSKNWLKDDQLLRIIKKYPGLVELNLHTNKIRSQKIFYQFQTTQIQELDLRQNQVSNRMFTHQFMFDKIKSLMIFNGKYKDGKKAEKIQFDQQIEDCQSEKSSISFNNPDDRDSDDFDQEDQKQSKQNFWYQRRSTRDIRYLKNVAKEEKLRIKKRINPYAWNPKVKTQAKQEHQ